MREQPYTDISHIEQLFRPLEDDEMEKALALIPVVEDSLRQEALNVGKDLDALVESGRILPAVLQSVVVDIVGRTLLTSTRSEPMTQFTQSALGYSASGTYLVPGGGLFIKNSELRRLGLRRQKVQMRELYDIGD